MLYSFLILLHSITIINKKMKSDEELVLSLKNDDKKAFATLYNRYWEKLYYAAYKRIRSQEETEDLIHDLFLEIWNNRHKIEIQKSFAAYIFTAIKFKIFRLMDAKSVRAKHAENTIAEKEIFTNNVEDNLLFNELYNLIEEKIEKLPKKCKIVFKLSRKKQFTVKEISKELNISVNTAQNHISKALKFLRLELNDFLIALIYFSITF